jgi:hypothetical protein
VVPPDRLGSILLSARFDATPRRSKRGAGSSYSRPPHAGAHDVMRRRFVANERPLGAKEGEGTARAWNRFRDALRFTERRRV